MSTCAAELRGMKNNPDHVSRACTLIMISIDISVNTSIDIWSIIGQYSGRYLLSVGAPIRGTIFTSQHQAVQWLRSRDLVIPGNSSQYRHVNLIEFDCQIQSKHNLMINSVRFVQWNNLRNQYLPAKRQCFWQDYVWLEPNEPFTWPVNLKAKAWSENTFP